MNKDINYPIGPIDDGVASRKENNMLTIKYKNKLSRIAVDIDACLEEIKNLQAKLEKRRVTRIYCNVLSCKNLKEEKCTAETIHLQPCAEPDNVVECSEFEQ